VIFKVFLNNALLQQHGLVLKPKLLKRLNIQARKLGVAAEMAWETSRGKFLLDKPYFLQ
jgi:hypothetical protein